MMEASKRVVMDPSRTHGGGQIEAAGTDGEGLLEAILFSPPVFCKVF